MRILIVKDHGVGPLSAIAEADIVITVDGQVIKDRDGTTFVRSLAGQAEPPTLNLGEPEKAGRFDSPGGEIGKGSLLENRAETPDAIRKLLEDSIGSGRTLHLHYRDRAGNETQREIVPTAIKQEQWNSAPFKEDYVMAVDVELAEPRSFKLSRIIALESR